MGNKLTVASLASVFAFGALCAGEIKFDRTENFAPAKMGDRQRMVKDTMLFSEALVKYGQFQNYLHFWIDRPLFWDRAMRPERFAYETTESFGVHLREARKYGMDGLGVFGTYGGRLKSFTDALAWAQTTGPAGTKILPIAFYAESGHDYVPDPQEYVDIIKAAQASPHAPRINGKVLISSYNYRMFGLDLQRRLHAEIRKGVGNGDYILMGDLEFRAISKLRRVFRTKGHLDEQEKAELVKLISDTLDVADGLHLHTGEYRRDATGPYCSYFDLGFLNECLTPALKEVYARPEYAGKILGFYIIQGYINHFSGMNHGEFGTSTLRNSMASVLPLNPDYLVFFEWNEVNENTMFQPTVYSGQTLGRLIRHYANLMRGRPPETYPGDDPSVPNIVLSHPITFKPGETVRFEVLNIPAGENAPSHDVQLELYNAAGARLTAFPIEKMRTDTLASITYSVPGGEFPAGSAIVPALVVDGVSYRGFHPLRVDATSRWNYKEVRGALRDLLVPTKCDFAVTRTAKREYAFKANLAFGEELASVELVADEDEVAACSTTNEYDTAVNDIIRLSFTTRPGSGGSKYVDVIVKDTEGIVFTQDWKANVNPDEIIRRGDGKYRFRTYFYSSETPYFVQIPKAKSAEARITLDASAAWDGTKAEIPVSTVLKHGAWSAVLSKENGFRVDVTRVDNLPDIPARLGGREIAWSGRVRNDNPAPVFHLRAISVRGRIWRSGPIIPAPAPAAPTVDVGCFDEWAKRPAYFKVPDVLVPRIDYVFSPECGDAIANTWHPRYNGTLAGGYCEGPMSEKRAFEGMSGGDFAPKWVEETGRWMLRFDGVDDYLTLPIEAFPLNAFTFRAEFRPHYAIEDMVLFRHSALWRASLCLFIRNGKLYAMWGDRDLQDPEHSTARFDTGLDVANDAWNALEVSYDFHNIVFRVNDREKSYPFDRRGYAFRPAIFGGHIVTADIAPSRKLVWFKGDLRALGIHHCAEKEDRR